MYKIIITTTDNIKLANTIKEYVLTHKLSPCVQIIKNIDSSYIWKEKIESAKEYMVLIKCKKASLRLIKLFMDKEHSYDTYELISVDMEIVNAKYRKWFDENCI